MGYAGVDVECRGLFPDTFENTSQVTVQLIGTLEPVCLDLHAFPPTVYGIDKVSKSSVVARQLNYSCNLLPAGLALKITTRGQSQRVCGTS